MEPLIYAAIKVFVASYSNFNDAEVALLCENSCHARHLGLVHQPLANGHDGIDEKWS